MRDYGALCRYLDERSAMPFAWGHDRNDCASFAAQAVAAMTGRNPLEGLTWANEDEANSVLNREGSMAEAVSARLADIPVNFAQRGDVGAIEHGNSLILTIVEGDYLAGPGPRGMRRLPRSMMVKAWRVA